MKIDLDTIEKLAQELGFSAKRTDPDKIEIIIANDITFVFRNFKEEDDNLYGFEGTPWHSHNALLLMTSENCYIELNDIEIISGIKDGSILIFEQYKDGKLIDRWIGHRDNKIDNRYMEPGEEMRIIQFPF
jgi:hypothetical protein